MNRKISLLFLTSLILFIVSCGGEEKQAEKQSPDQSANKVNPTPADDSAVQAVERDPEHLFILTGHQNMTANLRNHFEQAVNKTVGSDLVTVVFSANEQGKMENWIESYPKLLADIAEGLVGNSYKTVSVISMHGEIDARSQSEKPYGDEMKALIQRLRSDLKAPDLKFVIGRISDTGLNGANGSMVQAVRDSQVAIAEADANGSWIDTDDLIRMGLDGDGIRYGRNAAAILGERFARKAMSQLGFVAEEIDQNMSIGQPQ